MPATSGAVAHQSRTHSSRACQGPPANGRVPLLCSAIVLSLSLAACAHAPTNPEARAEYERINDPAEPTNRAIFSANKFVDDHAFQPVARGYENNVPARVRKSIHNFLSNLGQPAVAVNDVLQGNLRRASITTQRFAINTTVGGLGLFDVATDWNRPGHRADFGQTFGVWGIGTGPSVQLPLFGPSNVRDSVGKLGDLLTNPASLVGGPAAIATGATGFVDGRATTLKTTDNLEKLSVDYYAALRSATAQRRAALVQEGKAGLVSTDREEAPPAPAPVSVDAIAPK